jgi:hypothetical protein
MKARRKSAPKKQTKVKGRSAMQIVCYPGPVTQLILVEAAYRSKRSLASFVILSALREAARLKGVHLDQILPPEELEQYLRAKRQ